MQQRTDGAHAPTVEPSYPNGEQAMIQVRLRTPVDGVCTGDAITVRRVTVIGLRKLRHPDNRAQRSGPRRRHP